MKLARIRHEGRERLGAVTPEGLVPFTGGDLAALLASGVTAAPAAAALPLDQVRFLPFLLPTSKVLCAGLNYQAHADEAGRNAKPKPDVGFFVKLPSALVGHGAPIRLPRVSTRLDFEGELCAVIGRGGRHIRAEDALDHVAGYTILMDGSLRDYQKNSVSAGKNFDESGSVGPWMVTADEIPDPSRLTITTRVNGAVMQQGSTDGMIHPVAKMIAYFSGIMRLSPGDLIATGTPDGVGWHRDPPVYLAEGDLVEVEIGGIGTLANRVAAEG